MKKFKSKIVLVMLLSMVVTSLHGIGVSASVPLINSPNYKEISVDELAQKISSGESFFLLDYYSPMEGLVFGSENDVADIKKIIEKNNVILYGVDDNSGNSVLVEYVGGSPSRQLTDADIFSQTEQVDRTLTLSQNAYDIFFKSGNAATQPKQEQKPEVQPEQQLQPDFTIENERAPEILPGIEYMQPPEQQSIHTHSEAVTASLKLSDNPDAPLQITVRGGKEVDFVNLPKEKKFDYLMIRLTDTNGTTRKETWGIARNTDGSACYSFDGVSDGTYELQLFSRETASGYYNGYLFSGLVVVKIENGSMTFVNSPVFNSNSKVASSRRTDDEAKKHYLKPSYGVQSDNAEIKQLAATITKGISSDYNKAKAIHDWVAANIYYDYDAYNKKEYGDVSAVTVLKNKRSVCAGYSYLTTALLRAAGIPAKSVSGYAVHAYSEWSDNIVKQDIKSNHAWTEAFADGRWVIIDSTWDSRNKYENGMQSAKSDIRQIYFDITLEAISGNHKYNDYSESGIPKAEATSQSTIKVTVNGKVVNFPDQQPTIVSGSTLVPVRGVFEEMGFNVAYDNTTATATLTKGGTTAIIKRGNSYFTVNGQTITPSVPPQILNGRFMLPLRAVSEATGAVVDWDANTRTVSIIMP